MKTSDKKMLRVGIEPTTYGFGNRHSIQLSYPSGKLRALIKYLKKAFNSEKLITCF